jgi:uncharacterized protein (TIGR00290 family)
VTRKRTLLSWSSGKDSAWMLHVLRGRPDIEVAGLFTTVHEEAAEVAVHAVPVALLDAQARAAGLPLHKVPVPRPCPNAAYEEAIAAFVRQTKLDGVTHLAFGDLFLEDIRRYREKQFAASGVEPIFPLWGLPTRPLAEEMAACGLRAWIVCVDSKQAPREWAGRVFDAAFVAAVPEGIDPCGERGEFHTFAFAGPMFGEPIKAGVAGIVERAGFVYAQLRGGEADAG